MASEHLKTDADRQRGGEIPSTVTCALSLEWSWWSDSQGCFRALLALILQLKGKAGSQERRPSPGEPGSGCCLWRPDGPTPDSQALLSFLELQSRTVGYRPNPSGSNIGKTSKARNSECLLMTEHPPSKKPVIYLFFLRVFSRRGTTDC